MEKKKFIQIFDDLQRNGFWCYQDDIPDGAYSYVEEMNSLRFARVDEMFPNIEFIPFNEKKKAKLFEFLHPQKMRVKDFEFKIPPLEFEILYKEIILAGKKDIADALHLRTFFSEILKEKNLKNINQ